jgi:hypothetical protein
MEFRFRGLGFRVTWVFPPKLGFFFGVLKWPTPPFLRALNPMVQ